MGDDNHDLLHVGHDRGHGRPTSPPFAVRKCGLVCVAGGFRYGLATARTGAGFQVRSSAGGRGAYMRIVMPSGPVGAGKPVGLPGRGPVGVMTKPPRRPIRWARPASPTGPFRPLTSTGSRVTT